MDQSLNVKNLTRSFSGLARAVGKFHYIMLICFIVGTVGFTMYYINSILNNPPTSADSASQIGFSATFDKETIKKIDTFKYRNETTVPETPGGRTNPFTE